MEKRWNILPEFNDKTKKLADTLKISEPLCRLLVQRGYYNYDDAKKYFRPSLNDLHDPWLMKDMEKAVERILTAIKHQEKILVFGDYDVDGTTAEIGRAHV